MTRSRRGQVVAGALALLCVSIAGCSQQEPRSRAAGREPEPGVSAPGLPSTPSPEDRDEPARGTVTLGFAGDVHFELHLRSSLDGSPGALGPITAVLRAPDLMMLNLETAITQRGAPEPKLYNFRAPPRALDTLRAAGVDVVSLANNHAADYGEVGVRDTLAAVARRGLPAVGFGKDLQAALTPYTTEIRGTDIAVFAISDRPDSTSANWSARADRPGILAHRHVRRLASAVREAKEAADVVVVYAHWGVELATCPNERQLALVRALRDAGVDVLVGAHAHVLQGSGWKGDTYVAYGLGNLVWYHHFQPRSGVLELTLRDGEVVEDAFLPAVIEPGGLPRPLLGAARRDALAAWNALRGCTDLTAAPRSR